MLWAEDAKDGNPWDISFQLMFMMSASSGDFKTAVEMREMGLVRDGTMWVDETSTEDRQKWLKLVRKLGPEAYEVAESRPVVFVPLYEGKMTSLFDHRAAGYGARGDDRGYRVLPETTLEEHCDPSFETEPFYWVDQLAVEQRLFGRTSREWLIGWKDVTSATNERTAIFSVIPRVAVGHSMPLMFTGLEARRFVCLMANTNSMPFDYVARLKVAGLHLTYGYFKQLPVLPPDFYTEPRLAFITPKVLELTYTSHSLAPFARDLGHDGPPFAWDEDRRAHLRADLDAFYARAYGLTRDELRYILDPAEVKGPDYPSETFRVLKEKEIRQHGFYRTQRLVLEAWDRMETDGTFAGLDLGQPEADLSVPTVVLPTLADLPGGAWTWPVTVQMRDRLRYAAQYALWLMDPATDGQHIRFAIASLAEPALLTPLLGASDQANWVRLVGSEAQPSRGAVRLRPDLNAAWRSMFEKMITSGQLAEGVDGTWAKGQHFNAAGLDASSIHAQRAAYVLRAVRGLAIGNLTAAIAQEDNVIWMRFGHG